ncbi:MAG TPA: hypothetical protein VL486_10200 [Verrucomicrobiae bacterium]|nr:hypothetical protein [Verrucomicrobiae bacterium]
MQPGRMVATPSSDSIQVPRAAGDRKLAYLLVLIFACVSWIGVSHHEMWRDELQAWTIARDSSSLVELWRNMRVEAHPMLWHTLLFVLTRFTLNPVAMQGLHWLIAVASVYLFVRLSPFTRLQKVLFCFGYYPLYEYCALSRNYSLCMLFLFLFCVLVQRQPRNYIALACVIGLLACSHYYDWAIVLALVAVLIADGVGNPAERAHLREHGHTAIAAAAIVLLFQAFAIAEAWNYFGHIPPGKSLGHDPVSMGAALSFEWRALFPIPITNLTSFLWNTNCVADASSVGLAIAMVLSPLLLILFLVVFWRRDRRAFLLYGLGTLLLWGGQLAVGFGGLRHMGKHYLLLLASWWLASSGSPWPGLDGFRGSWGRRAESLASGLITVILAAQLIGGALCYWGDMQHIFSAAEPAVQALTDRGLADMPIAVSPDALATSISAYLGRKVYAVDSGRMQGFTSWDSAYYTETNSSVVALQKTVGLLSGATNRLFLISGGGDIVVQQGGKLVSIQRAVFWRHFQITKLAEFSQTLTDERFWIYLVERLPGT